MKDLLLRHIRMSPCSSQACRDFMRCSSVETERLLVELRDAGEIAFANGEWYVTDSSRRVRKKPKKTHPRQTDFFDPEVGALPFSYQTQLMFEGWKKRKEGR